MSVYVIALIDISDRERYSQYEQGFMEIFQEHEGQILAVEESPQIKEGAWPHTRTVLLEFPSSNALDRWYHSEAYQQLAQHRFAASHAHIAVIQGMPQPST